MKVNLLLMMKVTETLRIKGNRLSIVTMINTSRPDID